MLTVEPFQKYGRTDGAIPVLHPPHLREDAENVSRLLEAGTRHLSLLLETDPPEAGALLVSEEDWREAPREGERPYPYGLPYFTRSSSPPALVLPETLSAVFGPRTDALLPLTLWHELAHAFLLQREVVRTPVWFAEFLPQALSAAVARDEELPLAEHLMSIDREPGYTVRTFGGRASAKDQMAFQNLLLLLGDAAVREFGEGFLGRLVHALRDEREVVDEGRAEELLANALGPDGWSWLVSRSEF
jgi:hypothetical protein